MKLISILILFSLNAFAFNCEDAYLLRWKKEQDSSALVQKLIQNRLEENKPIVVDIGGEGRYADAININPQPLRPDTMYIQDIIPNWIPAKAQKLPFKPHTVDQIYLENAPVTKEILIEIKRVLKKDGKLRLTHPESFSSEIFPWVREVFSGRSIHLEVRNSLESTIYIE